MGARPFGWFVDYYRHRVRQRLWEGIAWRVSVEGRAFLVPFTAPGLADAEDFDDWEPWLGIALRVARKRFSGTFVDVGTNVGQTLLKVKAIDADWPYVGFEPNPEAWFVASAVARINALRDVTLIPAGLGATTGLAHLELGSPTDAAATLVPGFRDMTGLAFASRRIVAVSTWDDVARMLPACRIGVVKIDVEGAESHVLAGLAHVLARDRPMIVCEVLPVEDATNERGSAKLARQQSIETLLATVGYDIVRIDNRHNRMRHLRAFGVHADRSLSNCMFLPGERSDEVVAAMCDAGFALDGDAATATPATTRSPRIRSRALASVVLRVSTLGATMNI